MNSLRFRLVFGFALVAIVPMAMAMALMARHIRDTVRTEAAQRLAATLEQIEARFRGDGAQLEARLDLLARDAELRRLYLINAASGAQLREHLATQRFLLDLDFLFVTDDLGRVVADAAAVPAPSPRPGREPVPALALALALADPARGIAIAGSARDFAVADSGSVRVSAVAGRPALACRASRPILYRDEKVGGVTGGFVLDAAWLARLGHTSGVELALWDQGGRPIAATLAADTIRPAAGAPPRRVLVAGKPYLAMASPLGFGPAPRAEIVGLVSTARADEAIASLRLTGLALAAAALAIAIGLGLFWSHQVSRPVERLAAFSERISRGEWDEPLRLKSVREVQTLVTALERMRADLRDYRVRLVAGERQAAYGEMARKVAHEIKNPLTPIAISVADLKRSYDLGRPDFPQILEAAVRTIGEEVHTLKRMLQEFSDFGRFPAPRFAAFELDELLADLRTLFGREIETGRLAVDRPVAGARVTADRAQLRQALINLVQNGLDATAGGGRVAVAARAAGPEVEISVADNGPGFTAADRARLFVPGFTTKGQGSGLGLTIVERIAADHRGSVSVDSSPGHGAAFHLRFPSNLPAASGPEPGA